MPSITITPKAVSKIKEIIGDSSALRLSVQGGGCSGFSYSMQMENEKQSTDKVFVYPLMEKETELVVFVDPVSMMYLDGVTIDYLETLTDSGFKFDNPNVKSTCGCGQSFSA